MYTKVWVRADEVIKMKEGKEFEAYGGTSGSSNYFQFEIPLDWFVAAKCSDYGPVCAICKKPEKPELYWTIPTGHYVEG